MTTVGTIINFMSRYSITTRPGLRYNPNDWFTNSYSISTNSERQRDASHNVRQKTRSLRLRVGLNTKSEQDDNTASLANRVDRIRDKIESLVLVKDSLDEELKKMNKCKDIVENQMKNIQVANDATNDCLLLRDRRRGIDMVNDDVKENLMKELDIINGGKQDLQNAVHVSFVDTITLQEARDQILTDLQNKKTAMDIDIEQYKLDENCPGVSYKLNPTRIPPGTTTLNEWEDFTEYNIKRAEAEIKNSMFHRNAIHELFSKVANDIDAQAEATEFNLRRRQNEYKQALDELEWQKEQTEQEIADMERDLDKLEERIHAMIPADKLAQTRLERRTYRPGVELCRDPVQYYLTDEVRQIEISSAALREQQSQARHALDALRRQLARINTDIDLKKQSLDLETRCLELRDLRMDRSKPQPDPDPVTAGQPPKGSFVKQPPTQVDPKELASQLLV